MRGAGGERLLETRRLRNITCHIAEIAEIGRETRGTLRHATSKPHPQPRPRDVAAQGIAFYNFIDFDTTRQLRVRPIECLILKSAICSYNLPLCRYLRARLGVRGKGRGICGIPLWMEIQGLFTHKYEY